MTITYRQLVLNGLGKSMKCVTLFLTVTLLFVCTVNGNIQNQTEPIGKQSMLKNLIDAKPLKRYGKRLHREYLEKLIATINLRGVNFEMTPDDERQFISAGANFGVLDAIKKNYRNSTKITITATPIPKPTPALSLCKLSEEGPPVNYSDLEECIKVKRNYSAIELAVYKRKVDFILDDNTRGSLVSAGVPSSLIKAIDESPSPSLLIRLAIYNCDQAERQLNESKFYEARTLINNALKYDSSNPNVYRLRAELNLYQNNQIDDAFQDMRQALNLGGDASVRVIYDCGGKAICPGKLFINNSRVLFRPDNGEEWIIISSRIRKVKADGDRYNKQNAGFIIETKKTPTEPSLKFNFQAYRGLNRLRDGIVVLIKLTLNI
jgi:hypothetical protein